MWWRLRQPRKVPLRKRPAPSPTQAAGSSAVPEDGTILVGGIAATSPVPMGTEAVKVESGLSVAVGVPEAVDGQATRAGEIAGPALSFPVTVRNDGDESFSLTNTVVSAFYGADQRPAVWLSEPGGKPLPQTVEPGGTATGIFVFNTRGRRTFSGTRDCGLPRWITDGGILDRRLAPFWGVAAVRPPRLRSRHAVPDGLDWFSGPKTRTARAWHPFACSRLEIP